MDHRPSGKVSPRPILVAHLQTLVDGTHGRPHVADFVILYGVPVVVSVLAAWRAPDLKIGEGLAAALLAVAGLFGAFLFQLSIQLLNQAATWADTHPTPSAHTSTYADRLGGLAANTSYACFVSIVTVAVVTAAAIIVEGAWETLVVAAVIALLVHLALTLLMILRRVFLLSSERITQARTGASPKK